MRRVLSLLLLFSLFLTGLSEGLCATQEDSAQPSSSRELQYADKTPEQLQRLVAPIALYPDSLVAQILLAATFPEQAVECDRWLQAHPDLKGDAFAKAVDQQPWDPSVKALTAFPSVLGNMDKNLSWTSTLGDTYYNQPEDVMSAVQVMRRRAQEAGNLKTTQQQVVKTEGETIIVEPAETEVIYVPAYDPWVVYGDPVIVAWPGWVILQQRHEYAQEIFSDEGQQNGLYWQAVEGQQESPIGPLVAHAVTEGYAKDPRGARVPYRGYYFHILTSQGKHAPGGAKSYVVGEKMTGGFAFVAYPSEHRSSGVKTFLISTDGVVFEKDLGKNTEAVARSMKQFNPDSSWRKTEEEQEKP